MAGAGPASASTDYRAAQRLWRAARRSRGWSNARTACSPSSPRNASRSLATASNVSSSTGLPAKPHSMFPRTSLFREFLADDAAATIVPYDVQTPIRQAFPGLFEERMARLLEKLQEQITRDEQQLVDSCEHPRPSPTVIPVAGLIAGHLGTVEGRVEEVSQIRKAGKTTRTAVIADRSGELRVKFSPPAGADIRPGQLLQVTGKARRSRNGLVYMSNPSYRVLETPESGSVRKPTGPLDSDNRSAGAIQLTDPTP